MFVCLTVLLLYSRVAHKRSSVANCQLRRILPTRSHRRSVTRHITVKGLKLFRKLHRIYSDWYG